MNITSDADHEARTGMEKLASVYGVKVNLVGLDFFGYGMKIPIHIVPFKYL